MLDLVRNQLEPTVDLTVLCRRPYAGSERTEAACGATKEDERHFCRAACSSLGLESVDIGLLRVTFVQFDTFLSSMKHHQVLCLVCMLSMSCLHVV